MNFLLKNPVTGLALVLLYLVSTFDWSLQPTQSAHATIRTLSPAQTDMAAHAVGGEWHDSTLAPKVVDFGGNPAATTIGGMDQWLKTKQAQVSAPAQTRSVVGAKRLLVIRAAFSDSRNRRFTNNELLNLIFNPINEIFRATSYGYFPGWQITFADPVLLANPRSDYVFANNELKDDDDDNSQQLVEDILSASDEVTLEPLIENTDSVVIMMNNEVSDNKPAFRALNGTRDMDFGALDWGDDLNTVFIDEGGVRLDNNGMPITGVATSVELLKGWMMHELGHALQSYSSSGDKFHPSNYNNSYEVLDRNMPGHISAMLKTGMFNQWMPASQTVTVTAFNQNASNAICLRAIEYDYRDNPTPQILRINYPDFYYLVSAHRRVNGDEFNANWSDQIPRGIPEEGILIERVIYRGTQWKDVNGDRMRQDDEVQDWRSIVRGRTGYDDPYHPRNDNRLWRKDDAFGVATDGTPGMDTTDGLNISITSQPNADTWCVKLSFRYSAQAPDVGLASWRQPPGESYESTDIWIDSPLNGYGTFRYGMWNDLDNQSVPRGNGDDPAIGSINRVYARVHNYGLRAATNVKVQLQVSNPLGVGIPRTNGWRDLGVQLTAAQFPALASIPAQGYTDVYVDWVPDVALTPAQIAAGVFQLHSCVRVVVSPVTGETMLGNQDGSEEQENIQNFEATPTRSPAFVHTLTLTNESLNNTIVYLKQANTLPVSWTLQINNDKRDIAIPAMTGSIPISVTVPITVTAAGSSVVGSSFVVEISALENRELINQSSLITDPVYLRTHPDQKNIGGFNFTVNVLADTQIQCNAYGRGGSYVEVVGALDGFEGIHQAGVPLRAYAQLYDDTYTPIALDDRAMGAVGSNGVFRMSFNSLINQKAKFPKYVRCLFPGTTMLASSASGYVEISPTLVPTSTPEAWVGSQFHADLSLNNFLPPRESYGDQIDIFANTANPYICTAGRCPQLSGGVHGRSVQFSPANDTFLLSTNNVTLANAFSVGMWVQRDQRNITEWLLSHGANTSQGNLFALGFNPNNQLICSTFGDELTSNQQISDSAWHHVACVVDGNQRSIYIDGVLDSTDPNRPTGPYSNNAKLQIARRPDTRNSFAGKIDEINLYDYAITDGTISKLYNQPQSSQPPQIPISHLTFDDVTTTQGLVTMGCSGAGCPIVSYPNRSVPLRPSERLAAFKMQPLRGLTVRSTAAVASGNDSTLQFWSYFALPSRPEAWVTQLQANRPSITVSNSEIVYAGIRYSHQVNRFPTNQWHHYAFVKSGTQLLMYIDGNQVASGLAAATLLPFRVGTGSTLYAGMMATPNGQFAALELHNQALSADAIVQRYMQGLPAANVMPTATATMSLTPSMTQTPGQTYTPSRTIAVAMASKTAVALTSTNIKLVSQTAAPKGTQTRAAQLDQTKVVLTMTRWAGYARTEVAITTRSPVATKVPPIVYPTRVPSMVILADTRTATLSMTPNAKFSPTATVTSTRTHTPSRTQTVTLTASATAAVVATRTAKITMTDVPSPTFETKATATVAKFTATNTRTATSTKTVAMPIDTVALSDLPTGMLYRAMQHLYDSRAMAAGAWDNTYISPVAYPFYRPDIGQGKVPAYYEIAVFSDSARTKPAGYLLLTNPSDTTTGIGQIDFPVAHWDSQGEAVSTLLLKAAKPNGTGSAKLWKLDALSYLLEQNNRVISNLGDIPPVMIGLDQTTFDTYATGNNALSELTWSPNNNAVPDNLYKYTGGVVTTKGPQAEDVAGIISYNTEINPVSDFASYQAVYAQTFAPLIKNLRERTIRHWNLEARINPTAGVFNVVAPAETTTTIVIPFAGMTSKNIVVSDPDAIISSMTMGNKIVGGFPTVNFTTRARNGDETPRAIVYVIDGQQILAKWYLYLYPHEVTVVAPVGSKNRSHNWSAWTFFDAGSADDQRDYNQFTYGTNFSAVGAACLSGCGATAWMMLFGWADYKSSIPGSGVNRYYTYREGGTNTGSGTSAGGVAPKSMYVGTAVNPGLRNATLYIRGRISSVCQVTGASSTLPADMDDARYYLSYVGTGLGIDVSYSVFFYAENRIKNNTRAEIAYNHRPVVVGTGFGSHYPLAYRYAWRTRPEHWNEGINDGDDVVYSEFFYVNNGWGRGGVGGWTDAGVWYSGRLIRP